MTEDSKTATPDQPESEPSDDREQIRQQRDEYQDLLLRKTAELDNYRKRTERERSERDQVAAADLLGDLLPLLDDLERALAIEPESASVASYREGVELIHKQLLALLEQRGVSPIDSVGTDFDPNVHQAVGVETGEGYRDGEVVEEMRRGYMLRGRLLRAAMVRVAKA